MNFSAAASSSWVLTPGRTLPARRFIVRTRMSPAAAMRSISSGVFLMIIGASVLPWPGSSAQRSSQRESRSDSHVLLQAQRGDHRADVIVDLRLLPRAVDPPHQPLLVVVVDQRLGLVVVDPQALL